jgi:hypothetical protein
MEILGDILRRLGRLTAWFLVASSVLMQVVFGQAIDEYEVKAAFLYNFTKFVDWPNLPKSDAFSICILGDDPFSGSLDQLVKTKTAYNRQIQIRKIKEPAEARQCQIVFVRREEDAKAAKLVEAVRGAQVLTVSDSGRFTKIGGMIGLSMREGHVSVGVNLARVENAGLKISAKLMSLAKNEVEEP